MGVQGLWPLLEPVGRRVNIEALTNKRLAVDASIWLVQFIKAMRNEKGEMLHNAHLLGFFRRICRLLFHRIRPVFVFDGATPALKKRTTIARRRRREEQSVKLRKTAEKLLMNQLKKHALKNMSGSQQAAVFAQAKQTSAADPSPSDEVPADLLAAAGSNTNNSATLSTSVPAASSAQQTEQLSTAGDAMLAAQLQNEDQDEARLASNGLASTSGTQIIHGKPFTRRNSTFQGHLAPIASVDEVDLVMSRLLEDTKTASATHNILGYRVLDQSSGRVVQDFHDDGEGGAGIKIMHFLQDSNVRNVLVVVSRWYGGILLGPARFMYITDAARGVLEQGGYLQQPRALALTHTAADLAPMEESSSSSEGEAEALLPDDVDELDPGVLSTLPPSLQLEFALKLRERKQAQNREHFQKHTGQPQAFSSFQLQQYLKGTQLKRQMEKMKDAVNAAAGGDGIPTRRIAGDAGREYILQTEEDTKAKAALNADKSNSRSLSSGPLQIEIEVPADLASPHPSANDSSEEEWETVGMEGSMDQPSPSGPDSACKGARNWRDRASHRQKYWSRMTGFQFGRKLGDWGKDEDPDAKPKKELQASEVEDAELQEAIARSLRQEPPGGSSALDEEESDIEWMDSESGPSAPKPPHNSSIRASSSGAAALKPSLPPGPLRQTSARPPSYPNSGRNQQKPQMADLRLQHASTIGRHQAAADTAQGGAPERPELALGQTPSQEGSLPVSPTQPQGLDSSQSLQNAPMQSPVHTSQERQSSQPVSPITSPFKKVPPPWEQGQKAAPKGSSTSTAHQVSLPSAPQLGTSPLLGKRKQGDDTTSEHQQGKVKQLQHIIARADDIAQDQTRDSVLLDTLAGVPDDQAMPLSVEDRGAGMGDTAADNLKGRGTSPSMAASQDAKGSLGTPQKADPIHAEGASGNTHQSGPDNAIKPNIKSTDSEDVIDMTTRDLPSSSQPVSFDDLDEEFDADLIAAVDRSTAEHVSGGVQRDVTLNSASAATAAAVDAEDEPSPSSQQQHPAASQAADIIHHHQQQQLQQQLQQQQQPQQQPQQQQQQHSQLQDSRQQQQRESSGRPSLNTSGGLDDSLLALSEPGLGGYGSAALGGGPSMGVSSSLPSFDLDAEMDSLDKQTKRLKSQHKAQVRNADSPTNEMYGECQELLQMFGLPYIIAPMEAEAQCAWLDEAKLVDGVVTDDNDVFLFGGQHVYRNIFEGKKYVEEYRVQDVESELGMTRDKLIQLALLLGSDYTEGVAGIGIVNAVEIVNAFPSEELLVNFRKWVLTPDAQLITALGGTTEVDPDAHIRAFKHTHTGLRKNWDVPETFPNSAVIKAYKDAKVDHNKDKFTYGRPDLQLLRRFCQDKFGWQQDRADELLLPVLKAYDDNQTQMTLDSFLSFSQRFAKIKSRRLQKAVAGITGVANPEMTFADTTDIPVPKRRKQSKAGKAGEEDHGGDAAAGLEEADTEPQELSRTGAAEVAADADISMAIPQGGKRRGRPKEKASKSQASATQDALPDRQTQGRGRGRPKGRGRGRGTRGQGRATPASATVDEVIAGTSGSEEEGEQLQAIDESQAVINKRQLRQRSGRVSYDEGPSQQKGTGVLADDDDNVEWEATAAPDV